MSSSDKRRDSNTLVISLTTDESLVFAQGFAEYLRDHEWNVLIVTSAGPRLTAYAEVVGIETFALPMAREPRLFADLRSLVAWWRLIGRVRPRVLIAGTPKASLLSLVSARFRRVPVRVYHQLGLRLETTHGFRKLILWLLERLSVASATSVVAVSDSLAQVLRRSRISVDSIVIGAGSSHGVDTDHYRRSASEDARFRVRAFLGIPRNGVVIGFVGRLNRDKGLDTLARAFEKLAHNDEHIHLLIVGEIDSSGPVANLWKKSTNRLHQVGYRDDTRPYYEAMDILCLPTKREGMPNVVLEAQSMELPVVTTQATGARDSIVHGSTGILVPVDDWNSLSLALKRLIDDKDLREGFGKAGRRRVELEFEREKVWAGMQGHIANEIAVRGD